MVLQENPWFPDRLDVVRASLQGPDSFASKYPEMSASHEKSPTELTLRQHPSSRSSSTFSFCVWVPVCATLACWQVSNETRSVLGQTKMVPVRWTKYPAVPTGLAVGTNPPGLEVRRPQVGSVRMSEK